jgi:glycosyltransferase involved in cell wall biosynthesis
MQSVVSAYFHSPLVASCDVHFIATTADGTVSKKILTAATALVKLWFNLSFRPVDIVHIHSASRASFYRKSAFLWIASWFRKPIVFHLHGAAFKEFYGTETSEFGRLFIRKTMRRATRTIALSETWKQYLIRELQLLPGSIEVVHNPIPHVVNGSVQPNPDAPVVLFMGRIGVRKGAYDLAEAASIVHSEMPQVRFRMCGDGEVEQLKKYVDRLGISNNVELPGWISDKNMYYGGSDIYVLPSYAEGLPMSVIEAMAHGLPVVTTRVGGLPDIMVHGENGFLVEPGDITRLAEAIVTLAKDPELRVEMGAKNRNLALENFGREKIADRVLQLYDLLIREQA